MYYILIANRLKLWLLFYHFIPKVQDAAYYSGDSWYRSSPASPLPEKLVILYYLWNFKMGINTL
ncbi:hypothetical protein, partial [[Phormidium ambiguum] IAM M-71]|uniref:hypothetical protein n=1 Tax=[Phormidium ambiguum] IAM M-71 TaxID=454136 RepID=UPI001C4A4F6D